MGRLARMYTGSCKLCGSTPLESMWDRFDAVAVLSSTGYRHRQEGLLKELDRVGLIDRVEWFWDFDNPFMVRLANSLRLSRDIRSIGGFRLTMNHYVAVKTLLMRGLKHVLIMEDDVRFLNDIGSLKAGIDAMPDDYDLAKFEWTKVPPRGDVPLPTIRSPWDRLSGFDTACCAAVAYSDAGLRWRVSKIEECADEYKLFTELHMVDVPDTSLELDCIHAYVANPLLAVQNFTGDGVHAQDSRAYRKYGGYLASGGVSAYAVSR